MHDNELYVHSNYGLTPGESGSMKLATDDPVVDVSTSVQSMVDAVHDAKAQIAGEKVGLPPEVEHIAYFVDQRVFSDSKYGKLEFSRSTKVNLICQDGSVHATEVIIRDNGASERVFDLGGDFTDLYGRLDHDPQWIVKKAELPFRAKDYRVLSLTSEKGTNRLIRENLGSNHIRFNLTQGNRKGLGRMFSLNRGKVVFVVGHVEGKAFVDSASKFSISIEDLHRLAAKHHVDIVAVGCNSAASNVPSAVVRKIIHSSDVVALLQDALQSQTYGEFFQRLSSPKLQLLVDQSVIRERRTHTVLTILQKVPEYPYPISVATVVISTGTQQSSPLPRYLIIGTGVAGIGGTLVILRRRRRGA